MRRQIVFRSILLSSLILFFVAVTSAPTKPAAAQSGTVVFQDDFNGPVGSGPDRTKWTYDIGGNGWGNSELEYYSTNIANAQVVSDSGALDGKALKITAMTSTDPNLQCWYGTCQYTSAKLMTKNINAWTYGTIEIRAKTPSATGTWPAFWTMGDDVDINTWPANGELDIMEQSHRAPLNNYGTTHDPASNGPGNSHTFTTTAGNNFQNSYHTYTTTWTSNSITWYVDGVSYGTVTPSTPPIQWVYNHPFFILLNLAVGSSGSPFPDAAVASDYPQSLYVDYVKVSQTTPSANPYPTTYGTSTPFTGTAYAVPGKIEVENFDKGGDNNGYHDVLPGNQGGLAYRTDAPNEDFATAAVSGDVIVNFFAPGDTTIYTVNVAQAGNYQFVLDQAGTGGGQVHLGNDAGTNLSGIMNEPNTGGSNPWDTFVAVTAPNTFFLPAGISRLHLIADAASAGPNGSIGNTNNIDWFQLNFMGAGNSPTPGTPTNTPVGVTNTPNAPTNTPTFVPATNTPAPTATGGGSGSNLLYVIGGGTTLSFNAGAGAATDTIPAPGGSTLSYVISGVNGTYDSTKATHFSLFIDAGTTVGNGTQARISYDFNGDGVYDRVETYNYFATDPVTGWEQYTDASNLASSSGTYANLSNGKVKLEVYNAIGSGTSMLRVSATSANGQQSTVTIPFAIGGGATNTAVPPTATNTVVPPTATKTNTPIPPTNTPVPPTATKTNTPAAPTATTTSHSNILYVLTGASTLSFTAGTGAASDTIPAAGGGNHDGTPTNQITYVINGVSGTYSSGATQFSLYLDSGTNVGNGIQVRISYDFNGDGVYDRVETYHYFATDPVVGWENYIQTSAGGLESSTGSFANMSNGKVKIEVWSAIGGASSTIRTSATSANGQQGTITIPFTGVTG